MKKNLGKIGLLLLLLKTLLFANPLANYKLSADKTAVLLKEPVTITFSVTQKNNTDNMFFLLTPKKSPDYEIKLLKSINDDTKKHSAKAVFTYILFPLKVKRIAVNFDFIIQTSSDEALTQSYVDDHDGGKAIQKISKHISLEALHIDVDNTPQNIDFFGDFTLKSEVDKSSVATYESVNLFYTLQGRGYISKKNSILPNIDSVTSFSDLHNIYEKLTQDGYNIKKVYTYALSSTKDFKIPAQHFRAYSFSKHRLYSLDTPSYTIHIKKIDPTTLLNKSDEPSSKTLLNLETLKSYFIYGIIFLFGFISAKLTGQNRVIKRDKKEKFYDIKNAKTSKELILILINNYSDNPNIKNFITKLEMIEYKQSSLTLSEVQKEVLEFLNR